MRRIRLLILIVHAALVGGFVVALASGRLPRGVPGEWEWSRWRFAPTALDLAIAFAGVAAYSGFVLLGGRSLAARAGRLREAAWLSALVVASVGVQVVVLSGAPTGNGLAKWVTLGMHGSSGYYGVAHSQMRDPWRFWTGYPDWIKRQDSLHIGTHPPGLFLLARAVQGLMESDPALALAIDRHLPSPVRGAFHEILGPLPRSDRAALAALGMLVLLACAATVAPLYALARWSGLSASDSWSSASLWPLIPSATLFQPTFDTAFPLLSTMALALSARGRVGPAVLAGLALGLGMQFTLAFLPAGLVVALLYAWWAVAPPSPLPSPRGGEGDQKTLSPPGRGRREGAKLASTLARAPARHRPLAFLLATGLGFLAFTAAIWVVSGASPFVIWWWNQRNHARFYVEYPRSYLAWIVANPTELAVALGLPAAVWGLIGLRRAPRATWSALAVLALLNFSGRNLGEVARLWLPLMPPLLLAAGVGMGRLGGRGGALAATTALLGAETVALQSLIQVVYPE